jgi:NTP pyrophosphatase (non-canonical NTP hydrolase)
MSDWMKTYDQAFADQMRAEVAQARQKFGTQGMLTLLAALGEEHGEVCKAILQNLPRAELWDELLQCAAMCCRLATEHAIDEGDPPEAA